MFERETVSGQIEPKKFSVETYRDLARKAALALSSLGYSDFCCNQSK
jgi:hypothetical protein